MGLDDAAAKQLADQTGPRPVSVKFNLARVLIGDALNIGDCLMHFCFLTRGLVPCTQCGAFGQYFISSFSEECVCVYVCVCDDGDTVIDSTSATQFQAACPQTG